MQTQSLYKEQSCGSYGAFDIEITVAATKLPDLTQEPIRYATYDAVKLMKSAVMAAVVQANPDAMERKRVERLELLALFNAPILVEEIPNGYCSDWCCRHRQRAAVCAQGGPASRSGHHSTSSEARLRDSLFECRPESKSDTACHGSLTT